MSEEGFFRRWARLKTTGPVANEPATGTPAGELPASPAAPPGASALPSPKALHTPGSPDPVEPAQQRRPLPTMAEAARLTPDADFSAFVGSGVDKSVQRMALKTLFTDPHFNIIDGLDVYMSDYNKASPLTPAMLASLEHAQGLVARLLDDQRKDAEEQAALADGEGPPTTEQGIA
ncbi:DUF3306 domain-containing protein [Massilia sp. H6]|uniref:DUF3306 domain-containing protein n=1 Tax=Massilia sp. H6 TaxID=2970464 RepID=UPI0021697B4A|nr:DUF3306 domain-containing protein [Massilia sp. H6]UVW27391.1 DUF3306 domain-containing protein [Massilia sp. H6]